MDEKQRNTAGIKTNRFIDKQGFGLFLIKSILNKPLGKGFKFIGLSGADRRSSLMGIAEINRKTDDQRHNKFQDQFQG